MAKFRFYIADVMNGRIVGTNDEALAQSYADMEVDAFVVDAEHGHWLLPEGDGALEVEETKRPEVEE